MNISGIITEYNPFHLGHKFHLDNCIKDTNCDGVICVMSGNFVQRGFPALIDKWNRAEIAVKNGVDLVIELPLIYSIGSAEIFSEGAVKILDSTSVVNNLYFGSESGNLDELREIAQILSNEDSMFKNYIKQELDKGLPFHSARENVLNKLLPNIDTKNILGNSNNILAIEYLKALIKINSNITPMTIKRCGASYNEQNITETLPSATAIRKSLCANGDLSLLKTTLPDETYLHLQKLQQDGYEFIFQDSIFDYLKYKILTEGDKLSNIYDVKEGIDSKILKEINSCNSLDELILSVKSKRYTYTRISRILLSFFIGLENYNVKNLIKESPNYIRPLAFNETGAKILKEIKRQGTVKIVNKVSKETGNLLLDIDILGTKAYSVLNNNVSPIEDYTRILKLISILLFFS